MLLEALVPVVECPRHLAQDREERRVEEEQGEPERDGTG